MTLYAFELKKTLKRRVVWTTCIIMLCIILAANVSSLFIKYVSIDENGSEKYISGYEKAVETREYAKMLSGRRIDDELLSEMKAAYGDAAYREIYDYVLDYTGYDAYDNGAIDVDEAELYQIRVDALEEENQYWGIGEAERFYWEIQEERIEKPFRYEYCRGACLFLARINLLSYLWIFLIAICLSGSFGEEHARRTDQIILCAKYGKLPLYLARMAAGITFGVGGTAAFYLLQMFVITAVYGTGGFGVSLQLYLWMCSWAVSIGEGIFILFLVSLIASVACSVLTMLLSEALHNGIATLAVMFGGTFFTMFVQLPLRYRFISQVYDLLPARLLNESGFLDKRLFCVFGRYFTGLVTAPAFYLAAAAVFGGIGYQAYKRYEVSGR